MHVSFQIHCNHACGYVFNQSTTAQVELNRESLTRVSESSQIADLDVRYTSHVSTFSLDRDRMDLRYARKASRKAQGA